MKNLITLLFLMLAQIAYSQTFNLSITVKNIEKVKGNIIISVYNKPEKFLQKDEAFKTLSVKVGKTTETCVFKDLPKGEYAIALFHDKNSDGKCNRNFLGIPKEGYGFSKNIKPSISAPIFEDCKIELNKNKTITIELIN